MSDDDFRDLPYVVRAIRRTALIVKAPEMAAMLRELEWSGQRTEINGERTVGSKIYIADICPACKRERSERHADDCRLAALLKEIP